MSYDTAVESQSVPSRGGAISMEQHRRGRLLKQQLQLVARKTPDGKERKEIAVIPETLSFEKGFFLFIRAVQLLTQVLNFMPGITVISMDNYNVASRVIDGNFDVQVPIYDFKVQHASGVELRRKCEGGGEGELRDGCRQAPESDPAEAEARIRSVLSAEAVAGSESEETYDIYLLPPGEDKETCQSYLRMRNRDGRYSLMFEECVTDGPFVITPRITFEVSVRLLGGLMALGYEMAHILRRESRVFRDKQQHIVVKVDRLEQIKKTFMQGAGPQASEGDNSAAGHGGAVQPAAVQGKDRKRVQGKDRKRVQGKDRKRVRDIAGQLGMEGRYSPRLYIEEIQLHNLTEEVQALSAESVLKERFRVADHLLPSGSPMGAPLSSSLTPPLVSSSWTLAESVLKERFRAADHLPPSWEPHGVVPQPSSSFTTSSARVLLRGPSANKLIHSKVLFLCSGVSCQAVEFSSSSMVQEVAVSSCCRPGSPRGRWPPSPPLFEVDSKAVPGSPQRRCPPSPPLLSRTQKQVSWESQKGGAPLLLPLLSRLQKQSGSPRGRPGVPEAVPPSPPLLSRLKSSPGSQRRCPLLLLF
ncbi:unnamed protein product [Closterium sp. NIES-65]|nr:unnamed protein product [Closterium sp. NIES-65]